MPHPERIIYQTAKGQRVRRVEVEGVRRVLIGHDIDTGQRFAVDTDLIDHRGPVDDGEPAPAETPR